MSHCSSHLCEAAVSEVRRRSSPFRFPIDCSTFVGTETPSATKASRVLSDVTAESFTRRHSRVKNPRGDRRNTPCTTPFQPSFSLSLSLFPPFFSSPTNGKHGRGYLRLLPTHACVHTRRGRLGLSSSRDQPFTRPTRAPLKSSARGNPDGVDERLILRLSPFSTESIRSFPRLVPPATLIGLGDDYSARIITTRVEPAGARLYCLRVANGTSDSRLRVFVRGKYSLEI